MRGSCSNVTHSVAFEALPPLPALSLRGYFCVCPVTTRQLSSRVPLQSIGVVKDIFGLAACWHVYRLGSTGAIRDREPPFPGLWDEYMGDRQSFGSASPCS